MNSYDVNYYSPGRKNVKPFAIGVRLSYNIPQEKEWEP